MGTIKRMVTTDGFILASAIDATDIVEEARRIHNTSATATAALGRALSVASLIGTSTKADGGSVTLQFRGNGPGGTVVVVSDDHGNVRGYIQNPQTDVPRKSNGKLDVGGLIGKEGSLTVIKDLRMNQPYTGTVELLSGEVADDIASYFAESEQIPTACAAGVLVNPDGSVQCAGAYLIQLMPGSSASLAVTLEAAVLKAGPVTNMLRNGFTSEQMLSTVLEEFGVQDIEDKEVEYLCYCSRDRVEQALISTGEEELISMIEEQGEAEVTCQFCDKVYDFTSNDLKKLYEAAKPQS